MSEETAVTSTVQDPEDVEEVPSFAPERAASGRRSSTGGSRQGKRPGSRVANSGKDGSRADSAFSRPPSRTYTGGGSGNPEPRPGTGARVLTGTSKGGGMERLDGAVTDAFPDEEQSDGSSGGEGQPRSGSGLTGRVLEPANPALAGVPLEEDEAENESGGDDGDEYEKAESLVPPTFPWKSIAASWFGANSENALAVYAVFRDHYLKSEGIVFDQREWENLIFQNRYAFQKPRAESMVQLLVALLARKRTKKRLADDKSQFAAALRTRHGEDHFEKMANLMETYLREMDDAPLSVGFLVSLGKRTSAKATKDASGTLSPVPSTFAIQQAIEEADITTGSAYADKNGFMFKYKGKERIDHLIPDYTLPLSVSKDFDFDQFDHNPIGAFLGVVAQRKLRLLDMFRMLDRNRDGSVTKAEALKSMTMLKMPLTSQRLETFIDAMDTNGDGKIEWKEMVKARVVHLLSLRRKGALLRPGLQPPASGAASGARGSSGRAGSSRSARANSPSSDGSKAQASAQSGESDDEINDLIAIHKELLEEYESGEDIAGGEREALALLNELQSEIGSGPTDRVKVAGTGLSVNIDTLTELALVCHYSTRP